MSEASNADTARDDATVAIPRHSAPRFAAGDGVSAELASALGPLLVEARTAHGEILLHVTRAGLPEALRILRDEHGYQQLMEIAGVDFPDRVERFEVVYMLLSVTRNHRVMVKVRASEDTPVPTVTRLWPNAGWLEREVFDMYGVLFDGNTDLRRILTDYGFEGHPFRKDFPLTGYQEVRYSQEQGRVVYEPVALAQDLRQFDFQSPWEGASYSLPGDEKAAKAPAPPKVDEPKVTETPAQTGAGPRADAKAADTVTPAIPGGGDAPGKVQAGPAPGAPDPTENRPDRQPREGSVSGTAAATDPNGDTKSAGGDRE